MQNLNFMAECPLNGVRYYEVMEVEIPFYESRLTYNRKVGRKMN